MNTPLFRQLLIVEDNLGDLRLAEVHLHSACAEGKVVGASSLAQALDLLRSQSFDVILLDLGLPDATGIDGVKAIRQHCPGTALVVLTGHDDEVLADAAILAGAQDYVVKGPEGLAMLPRVIRHALDRQCAQDQLALAGQTAQALLDASHDMALLLDRNGNILTLNAQAADYLMGNADQLVGENVFRLVPESLRETRKAHFRRAVENGVAAVFEDSHDGRWFRNKVVAVSHSHSDTRVAILSHDITAERQAGLELTLARDAAEQANLSKTEFMGRMSRDIRTHLNDVIGFSEMMAAQILGPIQPPVYSEYAQNVLGSGTQILKLIDRITDVSMLESALMGNETYRDLVELSPDFICVCKEGKIERINAAGLGLLRAAHENLVIGKTFEDLIHPDYRSLFEYGLEALYEEDRPIPVKMLTLAGRVRDVEVNAVPLKRGSSISTLVVGRDTTDVSQAMRAVTAREQRIRAIMDTVQDGIVTTDENGLVTSANLAVERIFGLSLQKLIGVHMGQLMPAFATSADERGSGGYGQLLARNAVMGLGTEMAATHHDGHIFPVHVTVSELHLDQTKLYVGTIRDLTENKQLAQRLDYLANHDQLTDLPNRALFTERLTHLLHDHAQKGVAVVVIDLDALASVNDSLGHEAGDTVLRETARRISTLSASVGGLSGRLAGDEFAVAFLAEGDCPINQMVEQLSTAMGRSFQLPGVDLNLAASMGVSVYPRDGQDSQSLLRNAEMALHAASKDKDQTVSYFDQGLSSAIAARMKLERDMKSALQKGEFELYYQPQLRLADQALMGCEALIRWNHPELGLVPPDKFIPLAEETGFVVSMGEWVIQQACWQINEWRKAGLPALRVGVNISGRQFKGGALVQVVQEAIKKYDIPPALLDLELTESMLMDDQKSTQAILEELAGLGVHLSIDDFGTGYSSLAYLKRFPVHTVKIDRAFVRDLDHDEDGRVIAQAIIYMAKLLSMQTIAEGVETEAQAQLLHGYGCDEIQGWLIGKALPAPQFLKFVEDFPSVVPIPSLPRDLALIPNAPHLRGPEGGQTSKSVSTAQKKVLV